MSKGTYCIAYESYFSHKDNYIIRKIKYQNQYHNIHQFNDKNIQPIRNIKIKNKSFEKNKNSKYFQSNLIQLKVIFDYLIYKMLQAANKLLSNEQYQKAIDLYNKFIQSKPNRQELLAAYYNMAQAYDGQDKYIQSAQYYQKIIEIDPTFHSGQVYWEQGQLYQLAKMNKQSKQVYIKYLKFQPNHAQCHYNIGKILVSMYEYDEALKYLQKATILKPNYKKAYEETIGILLKKKKYEQVIKQCTLLLKHEPADYTIMYEQGYALLMMKRYKEAALVFKECLQLNKTFVKSYIGLGEACIRSDRYQEVLSILTTCLETNKDTISSIQKKQTKLLIGMAYEKLQKSKEALSCFREIVSQKPINEAAKNSLIRLLQSQGNKSLKNKCFSDALAFYKESISQSSVNNYSVINNMGLAYQNINNFKEAEKCFSEVLKAQPKNQETLNNIGVLYKITGRINESEAIFKRLAEEFPENLNFTINNGKIHMENQRYKAALEQFFKAEKMEKAKDNYELYNDISVGLEKEHRYEEALVYANKANKVINQKSPLILLNRANVYMKLQNLSSAKRDFQIAGEILRNPNKANLRMFGINEYNLKFMFNQLDHYAYLMNPIQIFREGLLQDLKQIKMPQENAFPTVIKKVQIAEEIVLSKIISSIVHKEGDNTSNPEQYRHSYNEIQKLLNEAKQEFQRKFAEQNQKISILQYSIELQKKQSESIKARLKYLPQSAVLRQKLDSLYDSNDKAIWQYGKQLYWILNGYLKGYMLISTGVVGKGTKIDRSSFNKAIKTVGGILQFANNIPIIGEFSQLISKICGLFVDIEDQVIIAKVYQIISFNYDTEQSLNDAICQTVLLFLNNERKIQRVRENLIFKPSEGFLKSISESIEDISKWFQEKKQEFILHMRGYEKLQNIQQSQLAVIDVGSIISVLLNFKSNPLEKFPAITNAAKRVLVDEQVQKMIVESYQRQNQNLRVSNNGFCLVMKCQITYDNYLLNDHRFMNFLKQNKHLTSKTYKNILNLPLSLDSSTIFQLFMMNQYEKITQLLHK